MANASAPSSTSNRRDAVSPSDIRETVRLVRRRGASARRVPDELDFYGATPSANATMSAITAPRSGSWSRSWNSPS